MDFTINLPSDECTCDAKVFYDKYRKQVDAFIQHELAIAQTSSIVVGKKALTESKGTSTSALSKKISKTKQRPFKKKGILLLPKIKGIRYKKSEDEEYRESGSVSVSTSFTESLPRIKATKKWSEDLYLSSSSLESPSLMPSSISSFDTKEYEQDVTSTKRIRIVEPRKPKKETKLLPKKRIPYKGKQIVKQGEQIVDTKILDEDEEIVDRVQHRDTIAIRKKQLKKAGPKILTSTEDDEDSTERITTTSWDTKSPTKITKVESRVGKKKPIPVKDSQVQTKLRIKFKDRKTLPSPSSSTSSSSEDEHVLTKEIKHKQPIAKEILKEKYSKTSLKKKKSSETVMPEDETSLISFDYKTEPGVVKLTKVKSEDDFVAFLISRGKKEGLSADFILDLLAKAREAGREEDLLRSLETAKQEGNLNELLISLSKSMESGILNDVTDTLIKEDKDKRRKTFILKLLNAYKNENKDENYLNDLIAKAKQENPDDELFLMLSKAADEKNLKTLLNNLNQAKRQGQMDDMVSVLMKKGKREQTNQLMSAINVIAEEKGKDHTFLENILSKAKDIGQKDELLLKLQRAKTKGNLDEVIGILTKADEDSLLNLLASKSIIEESIPKESNLKHSFYDDVFDADFLDKWFSKAKDKKEEKMLMDKLIELKKRGKSVDFSNITSKISIEDLDDLFSVITEILSDDGSDIDLLPSIAKGKKPPPKLLRRKKPVKKRKLSREMRQRRATAERSRSVRESTVSGRINLRRSQIDRMKQQLLYRRQYSFGTALPDVNYDLIGRHKLSMTQIIEREKSEEEEPVYEKTLEKAASRIYRESFLKKIYGGRKIGPTPETDFSSVTSSSAGAYVIQKRRPPRKKPKKKSPPDTEKDSALQIPQPRKLKKHLVRYARRNPLRTEKEFSDDTDISSFEQLLDKKISHICEIGAEDRSERGYLVGFRYKDDEETFDWRKKPKKDTSLSESNFSGEWMSRARRRAMNYFNSRKIEELFHFLGSHLVSDEPGDPIQYLIALLENCIQFRSGIGRPPLLFEHYHVESLYYSMDIFNEGYISLEQYRTGMETLFVREYKEKPRTNRENMVKKDTFIYEALKGQRIQLKDMLRGTSESIFYSKSNSPTTLGSIWSKIELYHDG